MKLIPTAMIVAKFCYYSAGIAGLLAIVVLAPALYGDLQGWSW